MLARKVGNLTIEKDFLKGKLVSLASSKERQVLVDSKHNLSLNKQCRLLHVNKSSLYYKPTKPFSTSRDIGILDAINNIYSDFPSYGYRRIYKQLQRDGYNVGKKFVKKAMKYMGIEALYPKPNTTIPNKEHYKYEYLLKEFRNYAGQIVIDSINKVMDDKGRATDNIYNERFWRTIKYEEIYLNEYKNIKKLKKVIERYMESYNSKRLHSAIGYQTPNEVYHQAVNNLVSKGVKKLQVVS